MSTFCLPDIRNTTNYEILCGQLTTGETMNSFVQSPGGSWILSLQRFLTNSTFTCVKNSDCAAKRQFREKVRATQCLIQVCVIRWMKCLAPIGCFSLSVIHHPLLLSAPFRVRHSGSCDFVSTYPCVFLHYIHEPPPEAFIFSSSLAAPSSSSMLLPLPPLHVSKTSLPSLSNYLTLCCPSAVP